MNWCRAGLIPNRCRSGQDTVSTVSDGVEQCRTGAFGGIPCLDRLEEPDFPGKMECLRKSGLTVSTVSGLSVIAISEGDTVARWRGEQ